MTLAFGLLPVQWVVEIEISGRFVHWATFAHMGAAIVCADSLWHNARVLKIENGKRPL